MSEKLSLMSRVYCCVKDRLLSFFSRPPPTLHSSQDPLYTGNAPQRIYPYPAQEQPFTPSVHSSRPQLPQGGSPVQYHSSPTSLEPFGSYPNYGPFGGSHHWSMKAEGDIIFNDYTHDRFMMDLLQHTAVEAMSDSSHRYPPPRCRPGTRRPIIERCKVLIVQSNGEHRVGWVVGPARVGKSAVMQTLAEEVAGFIASASIFFSVDRLIAGNKVIPTIAYQLAVLCQPYRQFIRKVISHDPSIFTKSLPTQFQKFIVEPFLQPNLIGSSHRFLILIDGLELSSHFLARDLLRLILNFRIDSPTSPIVWIVASRPEPYIASFFENVEATTTLIKEETIRDSSEAHGDIQLFLLN